MEFFVIFCTNIASAAIYDLTRKVSVNSALDQQFYDRMKKDFESDFRTYFKKCKNFEALVAIEHLEVITSFLDSPQIRDFFELYVNYLLRGSHYEELSKVADLSPETLHIGNEKIVNYLTKSFAKSHPDEISDIKNFDWSSVWLCLIEALNSIMVSYLSKEQLFSLFISHAKIDRSLDHTVEILKNDNAKMLKRVELMLKHGVVESDESHENVKKKYKQILKSNFSTAHIYLLGEFDFDKFYVPPKLKAISSRFSRRGVDMHLQSDSPLYSGTNWKDVFCDSNIIYVVGGAGYGKSLFLRNLIINQKDLAITDADDFLPIFCDLKNFSTGDGRSRSVVDFLQESMVATTALEEDELTPNFIKYHLKRGRCIILLDALDEVPKELRYEVHKAITGYLKNVNPNNRICITSRIRGFAPMNDIMVFDIPPLSKNQVENYVDNIIALDGFKRSDKANFLEQAKGLIEKRFLSSFLVLSLLVNIYKAERKLPESKLDLYAKCFEYIAKRREEEKNVPKKQFNWDKISPLMKDNTFIKLATLCLPNNQEADRVDVVECLIDEYKMTFSDEASCLNAVSEFLGFCAERTELFVPAQREDSFKFFHRSFFEYFYSLYISLEVQDVESIFAQFTQFDIDSEIFELTVSTFKQRRHAKYVEVVDYLLRRVGSELKGPSFVAYNILTLLVAHVISEPSYQEEYINILIDNNDIIVNSLRDREGIKNTHTIVALCEANEDFSSRVMGAYANYIDCELMRVLSVVSPSLLREISADYDFADPIEMIDLFRSPPIDYLFINRDFGFVQFYTALFLRTDKAVSRIDELNEITANNTLRELRSKYGMTKAGVKQCRANLAEIAQWETSRKKALVEGIMKLACSW